MCFAMTYFKITKNDTVVEANVVFLKWNNKYRCMFACDVSDAEFAQSYDQSRIYHDNWLKPVPSAEIQYEVATITMIDAIEFDEIRAMLDDGETVHAVPDEPLIELNESRQNDNIVEDDHVMTIAEMRQIISEHQEQITMLTNCLLEMSEVVYSE